MVFTDRNPAVYDDMGPILVPAAVSPGKTENGNKKVVTTKTIILILLNLAIDSPIKIFLEIT